VKLDIFRDTEQGKVTFGKLYIEGEYVCETLEDKFNEPKVKGETRIPAGTYDLKLRVKSPMADRYRARYGENHSGMIWLQDVPDFTYVYIHTGNDEDDTDGCPLVGMNRGYETIYNSRDAYSLIWPRVIEAIEFCEDVSITIHDASTIDIFND